MLIQDPLVVKAHEAGRAVELLGAGVVAPLPQPALDLHGKVFDLGGLPEELRVELDGPNL